MTTFPHGGHMVWSIDCEGAKETHSRRRQACSQEEEKDRHDRVHPNIFLRKITSPLWAQSQLRGLRDACIGEGHQMMEKVETVLPSSTERSTSTPPSPWLQNPNGSISLKSLQPICLVATSQLSRCYAVYSLFLRGVSGYCLCSHKLRPRDSSQSWLCQAGLRPPKWHFSFTTWFLMTSKWH